MLKSWISNTITHRLSETHCPRNQHLMGFFFSFFPWFNILLNSLWLLKFSCLFYKKHIFYVSFLSVHRSRPLAFKQSSDWLPFFLPIYMTNPHSLDVVPDRRFYRFVHRLLHRSMSSLRPRQHDVLDERSSTETSTKSRRPQQSLN